MRLPFYVVAMPPITDPGERDPTRSVLVTTFAMDVTMGHFFFGRFANFGDLDVEVQLLAG